MKGFAVRWAAGLVFWMLVLGGLGAIALLAGAPRREQRLALERKVAELEAEVDASQAEHDRLVAELAAVRGDPAYEEYVVRNELRLVRPGEKIYVPHGADEPREPARRVVKAADYRPGPLVAALAEDARLRVPLFVGACLAIALGVFVFGRASLGREAEADSASPGREGERTS